MIYVLVYPAFDDRLMGSVQAFRLTHEPDRARLVPPHVTLVFALHQVEEEAFLSHCGQIAQKRCRFSVSFRAFRAAFDPYEDVYKLMLDCGEGKLPLTQIHDDLYSWLKHHGHDQPPGFSPHMTVATHPDKDQIEQIDRRTLGRLPLYAEVGALEIVKLHGGELSLLQSVPFRNDKG
jgi:2'-5' RNA ligase